ncbi:16S rRNA (cytosine(1402)-N(4))-methyltransferase RsmH [candidate division WOR-3 bacterium]|uniref:Ribosomal RNA small subunit methyltransferase H n=1 Tax=candidate division WOR-3 bacterium TaxID=2052148 RepID=A0A9D5K9L9_UNCW3|nr:16S rRNA (cytosine(1402)-N(4))-methyltransferase RsmH [candidate division WOR-3 bacterium]MBD3365028.1 16S rRNA (cytosine(1402)-N(4))-methyltransferase RsmH [candidate division WOR-3 bacterium]
METTREAGKEYDGNTFHRSVMCGEVVEFLDPSKGGVYVDATAGGGGHTKGLLDAGATRVIALDMDGEALAYIGHNLACFAERLSLHFNNFRDLDEVLSDQGVKEVDGAVFDLGLSWHQVRSPDRGFSYQGEGPLDMRFDSESNARTALEIIRSEPAPKIARILSEYGEERRAHPIAREIAANRSKIKTTADLAELLRRIAGPKGFRKTAMRVFQALRIAVNDELDNLKQGLEAACAHLKPKGRLAVLSYHSLEDRIVKRKFAAKEESGSFSRVTRKPLRATGDEIKRNPAARSAKLRVLERA